RDLHVSRIGHSHCEGIPMMIQGILIPLFIDVALTFGLLWWLTAPGDTAAPRGEPGELGLLFYVLVALLLITKHADLLFVLLAWVFVVLRLLHGYGHLANVNVSRRGLWSASAIVLAVMWIIFAVEILLVICSARCRLAGLTPFA